MTCHRVTLGNGGFLAEATLTRKRTPFVYFGAYSCFELTNVFCHPILRRRGMATEVVVEALIYADIYGYDVWLEVRPHGKYKRMTKDQLTKWYESFGFKVVMGDYMLRVNPWRSR